MRKSLITEFYFKNKIQVSRRLKMNLYQKKYILFKTKDEHVDRKCMIIFLKYICYFLIYTRFANLYCIIWKISL